MGDPIKARKKYRGPSHPWEKIRIDQEKIIKEEYGLKNKQEIWKNTSKVVNLNANAKRIIARRSFDEQAKKEEKQVLDKLYKQGIIEKDSKIEDVLGLNVNKFLDRRLQTFVKKMGFASSVKQARQFITHGHIVVNSRKVTIPSYVVEREDEGKIEFNSNSTIANPDHPERNLSVKKELKKIEIAKPKEIEIVGEAQEKIAENLAQAQMEEAKVEAAK